MTDWAEALLSATQSRNYPCALRTVQIIVDRIDDDLTLFEIETIIHNLFSGSSKSLISIIKNVVFDVSSNDFVCCGLDLIFNFLNGDIKSFARYTEEIISLCLTILRSACAVKVKDKCFPILNVLVESLQSTFIPKIVDVMEKHIVKKTEKPTIIAKEYKLIGEICKLHPELVDSETLGRSYLHTLEEYMNGKVKISFPLLEGCFDGLVGFLTNFFEPYMSDIIYKAVKKFSNPDEHLKRSHARAGLRIIAVHGKYFKTNLLDDYKYWHLLLLKWINQSNSDDKKIGVSALFSYYDNIGDKLSTLERSDQTLLCLEYLLAYFKKVLSEKLNSDEDVSLISDTYEVKYALKGFTTLVSKCKDYFQAEEIQNIMSMITQRALLLYKENRVEDISIAKDATEESTEKIEELCNHIEALSAIGINTNRSLESLVCILITDFPKCKPHRKFIVTSAFKQALKVMDVQIIVSHFIEETCKYCVASSLYYTSESPSHPISYCTFMPLWIDILDSKSGLSKQIYDEFMERIFKTIPTLDLSTKIITNNSQPQQDGGNVDGLYLESFEKPLCFSDYRMFYNLCDLTASIMAFEWTYDWSYKWIEPFITMIDEGRKKYANATGFLRLGEMLLMLIKKRYSNTTISLDIKRHIFELLNGLSIQDSSGIFQLRAALMFLQAPPSIVDASLLVKSVNAFMVILKTGKSNLSSVSNALEILEEWNSEIDREEFRLLCIKVENNKQPFHINSTQHSTLTDLHETILPHLNDYLCSSGVSDTNVLVKGSTISDYNLKNHQLRGLITPELASLQHRIILFMGKMDSLTIKPLIKSSTVLMDYNANEEPINTLYEIEKFKISLPCFQQHNIELYLDLLVPRIKDIAMNSTNRDTRLTACQTLHSIILIVYGTCVTLPASQKPSMNTMQNEIFTPMLHLAADPDNCVSNMFAPLLKQTSNWYSNPQQHQSNETGCFISVLMKGACHPTNDLVQEVSCQVLNEFISRTIQKSSADELMEVPLNISVILRSVCQMMVHPHGNQARGALLIFDSAIIQLHLLDSAINKYLLDLLHSMIKCLESFSDMNDALGLKVLDKILKCLESKYYLFEKSNKSRRIPQNFGNGMLDDICLWLLSQGKNASRKVTKRCLQTFLFVSKKSNFDGLRRLLNNANNEFSQTIINYLEWNNILCSEKNNNIDTLKNLHRTLENYMFLFENHICFSKLLAIIQCDSSFILKAIHLLIKLTSENCIKTLSNRFLPRNCFENSIVLTLWKTYDVILLFSTSKYDKLKYFIEEINYFFLLSISKWILDPHVMNVAVNIDEIFFKNVKYSIHNIKLSMNDNWPMLQKLLADGLMNHPTLKLFKENNIRDHSNLRILTNHLSIVGDIMDLFESTVKNELLDLYSSQYDLNKIFKYLFFETSEYDNTLINCFDIIVNFTLKINLHHSKDLIDIMNNQTLATKYFTTQNKITCGKYFFDVFETHIIMYIQNNSKEFFDIVSKDICESNKNIYIHLIREIIKSLIKLKDTDELFECCQNLINMFNNLWAMFISWRVPLEELLLVFSLLVTLPHSKKILETGEQKITLWLLDCLNDRNIKLKNKPLIITLLPSILHSGIENFWYHKLLETGLECLLESMPLSCREFAPYTKNQSEYINIIKASLKAMANSGSYAMLEFVIKCTIVDSEHVCEEQINHNIKLFFVQLSDDEKLDCLKEMYKLVPGLSEKLLLNFSGRFLFTLLLQSSANVLEKFLAEIVSSVFAILNKQIVLNMDNYQSDRIFAEWVLAFKILETMFLMIPYENIDSPNSKIAMSYYNECPPRQKFVKDIVTRAFQFRKTEIPSGNNSESSLEFLRLAHCAAYRCMYAITKSRPQSDIKFYMILLNNKTGPSSKMWEGMIDINKKYSFSMVSNHESKRRRHLIPTSNMNTIGTQILTFENTLINFTQNSTNTKERRQCLLSQTIKDDILKFDLNSSLIRNASQQYTGISLNTNSTQSTWMLIDDELNNHECMEIICQVIREVHNLTENAKEPIPEWLKCIIDILFDKNRSKNVRLFFSRVVDNVDIFENYAKQLFLPMMSVINDRCTSFDSSLNHQDFCLLSLLLSWSEVIRPTSEDEILSATSILNFILEEIYTHSYPQQCTELLNTIITRWGLNLMIPYDFIIHNLESEDSRIIKTLKIVEMFLRNEIPTWNEKTLEKYQEILLTTMIKDTKDVYNLASKVAGLTLKLLAKHDKSLSFETKMKTFVESSFSQGKLDKFIFCLNNINKNYSLITDESMISKISYLLPRFPVDCKKKCLEIFLSSLECIPKESLFGELTSLKINDLIKDKDLRITSLLILNKSLRFLQMSQINSVLIDINFVCELISNKDKECREAAYDLLITLFNLYARQSHDLKLNEKGPTQSTSNENSSSTRKRCFQNSINLSNLHIKEQNPEFLENFKLVKIALLSGIDDSDVSLKEKVCNFWNEQFSYGSIQERWIQVCLEFFANGCSGKSHLLGQVIRIIFGRFSTDTDFKTVKCFERPLEDCSFEDYDWKVSNNSQYNNTMPLFAETLNSQLIISNIMEQSQRGSIVSTRDMQTLNSISTSKHFSKPYELILKSTIQSFSETFVEKNAYLRSSTSDTFVEPTKPDKDNLRKKLIDSKTQKSIKFSGISAYKKKSALVKKINEKPLQSYKRFRKGEYPDIQIFLTDILLPLMELTARDLNLAKDFFIIIFKCVSKHSLNSNREFEIFETTEGPISIKNFDSIALKVASMSLKNNIKLGLGAAIGECLLEICRLSLNDNNCSDEFDQIINDAAKICDIQWLGKLILEEKKLKTHSFTPKRLKYTTSNDKYRDKIYKYESTKNYPELQKIYADAASDEDTNNYLKKSYTENFFHCFAQLSDWDGFIEQMNFQFSSNNDNLQLETPISFDYNCLWDKTWMKNSLLSLTFNANIHRFADIIKMVDNPRKELMISDFFKFESVVNSWLSDSEKNKFMNTYLPIQLALWKMVKGDNGLFFLKSAIEWVKSKWMNEYMNFGNINVEESSRNLCFCNLQMVGEFCSILETPLFSSSVSNLNIDVFKKYLNKITNIWKYCNPNTHDQVTFWNLRLTARSVLVFRLQNMIEQYAIDESSDLNALNKIQRASELCLVKTAIANCNSSIGEKIVTKEFNNLDPDEEISWGLQWALINKLKALHQVELKCKLESLLSAWKIGENLRKNFASQEDPVSYIGFLTNSASISYEIFKTIEEFKDKQETLNKISLNDTINEIFGLGNFVINYSVDNISLIKYGKKHFDDAIEIVENNLLKEYINNMTKHKEYIADTYLAVAKFYKNINEKKDLNLGENLNLQSQLVKNLLKSMIYGNIDARKMFPILLTEFEKYEENHEAFNCFKTEVINIPCWMFLPWVSQLLAHFPTLYNILFDLIVKIGTHFPQSIVHQYRLSKRMWKSTPNFETNDMKHMISVLDKRLLDNNIEMFVEAMSSVCDPNILLKTHLEKIATSIEKNDSVSFKKLFEELFEEVFPDATNIKCKVRGPIYKQIENFKPLCEMVWTKYNLNNEMHDAGKQILTILKSLSESDKKNSTSRSKSINDFSPFLYKFDSFLSQVPIHIFGHYNTFESSYLEKCTTIAKFSNEVTVIGSLRRPIRISIIGSDGIKYSFLLKRGEDLRQDERIQQLFDLMNNLLNKYSMKIVTYKIIPLTWDCGVIEWLDNYATLKDIIYQYDTSLEDIMNNLRQSRMNYVLSKPGNTMGERYANLVIDMKKTISSYNELLQQMPKYLLRDALFKLAVSPEKFVYMRSNYIHSLAAMNISNWVLGIGDRHLSNCLLNIKTGNFLGIDFGYAFGTATQFLSIPELIPFRLTPQIVNVMAPCGVEDKLRHLMIQTLDCFKENSDLLIATLEVFVFEPTLNWMDHIVNDKSESISNTANIELNHWSPQIKINQCKLKLSNRIPLKIILEDLENAINNNFKKIYQSLVKETYKPYKEFLSSGDLSTAQQVDCLLNQAVDENLLAVTYFGWDPWV